MNAKCSLTTAAILLFAPIDRIAGQTLLTNPHPLAAPDAPVVVEDQCATMATRIKAETLGLLKQRNYQGLDDMAARLRRDNITFPNGDWTISFFYAGVTELAEESADAEWQERMQALRDWFETDTDSITARVAFACGLFNYAWQARGHGWARDVGEDGWRQFGERMTEARRILIAAERLNPDCPMYYSTRLRIAFVDGSSPAERDGLFDQCIRAFPTYPKFYLVKANFLLPRWFGAPGEWEAFAATSANRVGEEGGDMLYAQIVWSMHEKRIFGNIFQESAIEWPRVQRGFEALYRRHPDSVSVLSEYCYLAGFSEDGRSLMRSLMQRLGNRVDLSVWKTMDRYLRDRTWSFAEN
jgi:hypothetical protein